MYSYKDISYPLYARNGLFSFLKNISHSKRDCVLVPSYSCGDEIEAVIESGFSVKPYRIKMDKLEIDLKDLKNKATRNVKGIILTHYFGFPQKGMKEIIKIAKARRLFVVEDCAHCLLDSRFKLSGDAAIFSLRKFFPMPNGGALMINGEKYNIGNYRFKIVPKEAAEFDEKIYRLMNSGRIKPGTTIKEIYLSEGEYIREYGPRLERWGGYSLGMSPQSVKGMKKMSVQRIASERRKMYREYAEFFKKRKFKNIKPVFGFFDDKVVPLFFPIMYEGGEIKEIRKKLLKHGNIVRPFWEHPHPSINRNRFKEIGFLRDHILILPMKGDPKTVFGVIDDVFV